MSQRAVTNLAQRLVGEYQKLNVSSGKWLGETFGWAYAGDSIVAILAGQLASFMAGREGPTGPFTLSVLFLTLGSVLAIARWGENIAPKENKASVSVAAGDGEGDGPPVVAATDSNSISSALTVMSKDRRILLLGAVQALFEGAMYIFVLQWPPAFKVCQSLHRHLVSSPLLFLVAQAAILNSPLFASSAAAGALAVPFGNVFSCFMACCLIGSTFFGYLQKLNRVEV